MAVSNGSSSAKTGSSRLYILGWGLIALVAASYLGALIFRPELVEKSLGLPVINQESNQGTRSLSRALVELKVLENKLRQLKVENARLKSQPGVATGSDAAAEKSANSSAPGVRRARPLVRRPSLSAGLRPDTAAAARALPAKTAALAAAAADNPSSAVPAAAAIAARFSDAANDGSRDAGIQGEIRSPAALAGVKLINAESDPAAIGAKKMPPLPARRTAVRSIASQGKSDGGAQGSTFKTWEKLMVPQVDAYGDTGNDHARPVDNKRAATVATRKVATTKIDVAKPVPAITTGSVAPGAAPQAAPVIRFGAAEVKRAASPAVALTTGPSVRVLQLNWLALKDRFGADLGALQPRYVDSGRRGAKRYQLIAGPLRSGAEALQICSQLGAQDIACTVSTVKGRRL